AEKEMIKAIDKAKDSGDTLGGVFTVVIWGLPPGFGSYDVWENRLDGRFAKALMSVSPESFALSMAFIISFSASLSRQRTAEDAVFRTTSS
ncbi:chorismate synthase, partial [bacterium]|nr:chorismate synthase [bacterium]MBU3955996.1 chorismate synthase [bacterium]